MRVFPFELRAPRQADHRLPLELNSQSEKLNLLAAASVITARGDPLLLPPSPPPGPRRSPNAQTISPVPDIGQKTVAKAKFPGEMARKPRQHRDSEQFRSAQ